MMLKKLKRKFILINMLFVAAVLLCVFAAVCTAAYRRLSADMERALEQAVTMNFGQKPGGIHKPQEDEFRQFTPSMQYIAVLSILIDEEGTILETYQSNAAMSEDILISAAKRAAEAGGSTGTLGDLNLSYMKKHTVGGIRVAFADITYLYSAMRSLILTALLIGALSMIAFFFISLFLANWALRPVEGAWLQQQRFIADASHELKTPLTVILANNSILRAHPEDTVRQQEKWINSTQDEAEHMKTLVDNLLFLARSDAAEVKSVLSQLDLSELVWGALLQFEPVAFEKNITLTSAVASDLKVCGDRAQLKQLIHILLDNACKYAGADGAVRVSLYKHCGIILEVHNTGLPISENDLPHIFERFYRSDKARGREGGYGLGLSIAKSIADRHKSQISVLSSAEAGTTFSVRFPQN